MSYVIENQSLDAILIVLYTKILKTAKERFTRSQFYEITYANTEIGKYGVPKILQLNILILKCIYV